MRNWLVQLHPVWQQLTSGVNDVDTVRAEHGPLHLIPRGLCPRQALFRRSLFLRQAPPLEFALAQGQPNRLLDLQLVRCPSDFVSGMNPA
jgi:hypothetical protein